MKRKVTRCKSGLIPGTILGISLILMSSITAFAETNDIRLLTAQTQNIELDNALLQKQQEIDKYVFQEHAKEIEKKGFKVTHTGQIKDYVEIGITPFNKENADYLYKIFGKDKVKVVEGQQAVLMNGEVSTTAAEIKNDFKSERSNTLVYIIVGVVTFGAASFIITKRKTTK